MKRLTAIIIIIITFPTLIIPVESLEKENVFFINMNGVELTEEEYNNLLKGFNHDTINTMTEEMINPLKGDKNITKLTTTKYVKTEVVYNGNKVINTNEFVVSEEDYKNSPNKSLKLITPMSTGSDYVETTYKKITLDVTFGTSYTTKYVTLTNVWKQIPVVKTFDVLAVAPGSSSISFNLNGHRSGYQKWDGNTINYSSSSGNWKLVNGNGIFKKGLGLSQNLVDATTTTLSNSITVVFVTGDISFTVRGSYQHATSDLSLAQSQNYTLGTDGMGGLIKFNSSIWSKYDNTPGLEATLSL